MSACTQRSTLFVTVAASAVALITPAHATTLSYWEMLGIKSAQETISTHIFRATGSLRICAANEVKNWIAKDVLPAFQETEKAVSVNLERDVVFSGSGELADALNDSNSNKCDVVIMGSDVSALRASDFEKEKSVSLAYSPIVYIGQKDKLAAARAFLKKGDSDPLSCTDLATVAKEGRLGRIKQGGGTGRLTLEMSTSNSGQAAYFSCVYSTLDATSGKEVEEALSKPGTKDKEKAIQDAMAAIKFDQSSSERVKDAFVSGDGLQVPGASHLAIATYESYVPEILKLAEDRNVTMEVIYPEISILSNFPAFVVSKPGTPSWESANAFLKTALSLPVQTKLIKYGLRPGKPGIKTPDYMNPNIGVGDSPRNRSDLKKFWDVVGKNPSVLVSKVTNFPN